MTKLQAINNKILATDGKFHIEKSDGGIILPDISDKATGLIPRWFKVYSVGNDIDWVKPGQWIYVAYGRWTEGFKIDGIDKTIWMIEDKGCMLVSDEEPDVKFEENSKNINAIGKTRDEDVTWS